MAVVLYHVGLSDPVVGASVYAADPSSGAGWLTYLLTYTPLHVIWAGSQAVLVFFVLSGFVLTLPMIDPDRRPRWLTFMRGRVIRIYLPSIASLCISCILALAVHRTAGSDLPRWPNEHVGGTGLGHLVLGWTLVTGFDSLNGSLWSLRWEIAFSLLLPLFLWFAVKFSGRAVLKFVLLSVVMVAWPLAAIRAHLYANATYIIVFGFGVLMAYHFESLKQLSRKFNQLIWFAIFIGGCVLLTLHWILMPFGVGPASIFDRLWMSYNTMGAVLLVFCGAFWTQARVVLQSRIVRLLGLWSFSLYLVQEPVIVTVTFLTRSRLPLLWALIVEVPTCVILAYAFYRWIEKPAHRIARRAGRDGSVQPSARSRSRHRSALS